MPSVARWRRVLDRRGPILLYKYVQGADPRGFGASYAGASSRTYIDNMGIVRTAASGDPRYQHFDPANPSLGPLLLLEGSRTNLVVQSESLLAASGWTISGPTQAGSIGPYAGLTFTRSTLAVGANGVKRAVTLTGDGVKAVSVFAKGDGVDGSFTVVLYDTVAATSRMTITVTVASGVLSAVASVGTLLRTTALASGVYRFECVSTSCTAANAHELYPLFTASQTIASALVAGPQVENAAFPSSYIPTTTAAVTRAADALSFPFLAGPQAMTVYADAYHNEADNPTVNMTTLFIGTGSATAAYFNMRRNANGTGMNVIHQPAAGAVVSASTNPTYGQRVEHRGVLNANGSVISGVSIAGGAESVGATSGASALDAAWSALTMTVGACQDASSPGFLALRSLKVAAGIWSQEAMRRAA